MRKRFTLTLNLLLFMLVPILGLAQSVENMPNYDGGFKTVSITENVQFYDAGSDTADIATYQVSGITFTPKEGEVIQVVFETIDLQGGAVIKVFDGAKTLDEEEDWSGDYTYSIPTGSKKTYSGNATNETIRSYSADGKLTICFQNANGTGTGWKATVKSITRPPIVAEPVVGDVNFPFDPKIYTISTPINFYDDGGKTGKISQGFNGKVTFKPTTVGTKIKIEFTLLDLFNTSTVGYNDILKVYSGTEVNEANLLATILKQSTPITVKSTSADGALTLTLVSTAGYPKPGFESVVSEFTPQPMAFSAFELSQYTEGTVCASDVNQPILAVNVKTINDLSPITVSSMEFNAVSTHAQVTKASVYYTQGNNAFSTTSRVGEVNVTANNFVVTLTTPQALIEGNNYFWLAYDINPKAQNDLTVDAACTKVSLSSGDEVVVNSSPEGNRTVKNVYVSTIGTFERTIYSTWDFTHTPNTYGNAYMAEEGDQIITFKPGTKGKIIDLTFTDFDLYYSANNYGTKAKFEVYSGTGTSGELLWELKNAEDKSVGPKVPLRSAAADGSLTVVFNANTTSSHYTAKGWHAKVAEYQPVSMSVKGVNAFQSNNAIIKPGATNQEIIGSEVETEGNLNPISLNEVVVGLKDCSGLVKKLLLYSTGISNSFAYDSPICEKENPTNTETLILSTPLVLNEGKNYIWVAYDMVDALEAEQVIDALLTSVKVGTKTFTPQVGDPDGNRITKNIYEFEGGEKTVKVAGSLMFYDNGGADNNYSTDAKGTVTFIPNNGQYIKLIFKAFNTRYNDYFYVYSGSGTTEQLAKLSGSKLPATILSTAADGSLTIKFEPKYSYNAGWEIEVQSYTPKPLAIAQVKSAALGSDYLYKGSLNQPMLRIDVHVEGDKGDINLNRFEFATNGTTELGNISNAKLCFTDTVSSFSPDALYGSITSITESVVINGSTSITKEGVYKFWLAYDISNNAARGNKIQACLTAAKVQNISASITETKTATKTVKGGFSGNYIIGSSSAANFKNIALAVESMHGGIDGKVVFEIEPGTYNELVKIPHIEGASPDNTITIKSQSGDYNDVIVEMNSYSSPAYGEEKFGLFTINGADYTTIEGITVKTTSTKFPAAIQVKNVSRNVTVRNCRIQSPKSTSYSSGDIKLVSVEGGKTAYSNSDNFTIEGCVLDGGYTGVEINGASYIVLPKQKGGRVLANRLMNQGSISIYMCKEHGGLIDGNVITNTGSTGYNYKAIDAVCIGNTVISNNRINANTDADVSCIYLRKRDDNETLVGRNRVYNNEIIAATTASSKSVYGINVTDNIDNLDIAYNSVNITKARKGAAIYVNATLTNSTIENNLLQNSCEGYTYYFNKDTYAEGVQFKNNALYTESAYFAYAGSNIASFNDWVTFSKATGSLAEKATFVSDSTLELSLAGSLKSATPVDFVTTDINGVLRSATAPTIGAHEYAEAAIPTMVAGYPKFTGITHCSAFVTLKSTQSGKAYFVVLKDSVAKPAAEDVLAGKTVALIKNMEALVSTDTLKDETSYIAYFVLKNSKGESSEVIASDTFKTANLPTEVSTFEDITSTGEKFKNGTASFTGFSVVSIENGIGASNRKAAKIDASEASVVITNSKIGLILTGFYLDSDTEVVLKAKQGQTVKGSVNLSATSGKWFFVNLKKFNEITAVELSGTGNILVDNFSGTPQPITFSLTDTTVNEGETFVIESEILGGVAPYSYAWTNAAHEVVGTTSKLTRVASYTAKYRLTVTDAWENTAEQSFVVTVKGKSAPATFDDLYLAPESHWRGDSNSMSTTFLSGSYSFTNSFVEAYNSWGGFGYSNRTSTSFSRYIIDQFNSAVGHGVNASANYSVVYTQGDPTKVSVTSNTEGAVVNGFFITNNAWVMSVSANGTGMESHDDPVGNVPFKKGDWYKITATADNDSTLDFYLADYRAEDTADHYVVNSWQWFDLRKLGRVKWVKFRADGTRKNNSGSTIPFYFCMDDFGGSRIEKLAPEQIINPNSSKSINVGGLVSFDTTSASSIVYALADEWLGSIASVELNNQFLDVEGQVLGSDTIVVSATQKGITEFIRIPLKVATLYSLSYTAGNGGTINGAAEQIVEKGQNGSEVEAVPNIGYHFVKWSDGVITAKRTDEDVNTNISVTAEFAINTFTLTYVAGENGSIAGNAIQIVEYGSNGAEVEAVPSSGFKFIRWSDGLGTAKRTEINVTADLSVTAEFDSITANSYTLNYSASVGGSILGQSLQTVAEGADGIAVEAVAGTGYHFVQWSDGVSTAKRTDRNVTANITVGAQFAIDTYTLTFSVKHSDGQPVAGATISINSEELTTDQQGEATISLPNGEYTYSVALDGYHSSTGSVTVNGENAAVEITLVSVGIDDSPLSEVSIYPNPFNDRLVLANVTGVRRIVVTSIVGQQVINQMHDGNAEATISTSYLRPGIYLVTVYKANGSRITHRVVKR